MSNKLAPTFVESVDQAAEAIFDGVRARPCCAVTQDGRNVVCSARTARKNGWTIVIRAWK